MTWRWEESSPEASANADAIRAAIAEGKPLCAHCFKLYVPQERSWFHARSILAIPDSEANPMLCDECHDRVVGAFNRHVTNIGTSNFGPSNTLLAQLA